MKSVCKMNFSNDYIDFSEKSRDFFELSNAFKYMFILDGFVWWYGECYFQAMKHRLNKKVFEYIVNNQDPKKCYRLGNEHKIDTDIWNKEKVKIMKRMLFVKFRNSIFLKKKLLETGDKKLVKIHHRDLFWGYDPIKKDGKNMYGKLLEEVREELRHNIYIPIQKLSEEDFISQDDLKVRSEIKDNLKLLPDNFILKLRHLLPQSGCLNNCSFCSQYSKSVIYELDKKGLMNVLSALKTYALEVAIKNKIIDLSDIDNLNIQEKFPKGLIGYKRTNKLGFIFPYFDNEILSYPLLDLYISIMEKDFNLKVRLSSIGFNSKNIKLLKMNERISIKYAKNIESFRISFTPYSFAYKNKQFKNDFLQDVIRTINIYSKLKKFNKFKIEVRHNLFLKESEIVFNKINNYDIIGFENNILIGTIPISFVTLNYNDNTRKFTSSRGSDFIHIKSKNISLDNIVDIASKYLTNELDNNFSIKKVKLYKYYNKDGEYYAIDPWMKENGFYGFYIYPKTYSRTKSGYLNAERILLNAILDVKRKYGLNKNDQFLNATEQNILEVQECIEKRIEFYKNLDEDYFCCLKNRYLPFIMDVFKLFSNSNLEPKDFFDKSILIDTGDICNLGKGLKYYEGFVSDKNIPLTLQHELSFGNKGKLASEEEIYGLEIKNNSINITRSVLSDIDENGQVIESFEFFINTYKTTIKEGIQNNIIVGVKNG